MRLTIKYAYIWLFHSLSNYRNAYWHDINVFAMQILFT